MDADEQLARALQVGVQLHVHVHGRVQSFMWLVQQHCNLAIMGVAYHQF